MRWPLIGEVFWNLESLKKPFQKTDREVNAPRETRSPANPPPPMETRSEVEEALESLSSLGKNPSQPPTDHPPPPPTYAEGGGAGGSVPVRKLQSLLFRRMLVGVNDGRFFVGAFHCIDKQGNIILQDAVEFRSTRRGRPSPMEQRCLGLILIPASCRTSCHVDCSVEEQISLLSLRS